MGIINKRTAPPPAQHVSRELPPLAREVVERSPLLNSPEVPDELPTLKDIAGQKITDKNSEDEEILPKSGKNEGSIEMHMLSERMDRIESMLKSAGPGKFLTLRDGKIIHSLSDLRAALVSMSSDTFNYHVNFERNDFANWVRNVFGEKELAEKIDSATSKAQLIRVLNDYFD